jgi:hypothetical protein
MNSSRYKLEWLERPVFLPVRDRAFCISFCILKWGIPAIPADTGMELITMRMTLFLDEGSTLNICGRNRRHVLLDKSSSLNTWHTHVIDEKNSLPTFSSFSLLPLLSILDAAVAAARPAGVHA